MLKTLTFALPAAWLLGEQVVTGAYADVAPAAKAPPQFMPLSRLLTGHNEIDDALADMAWSALVHRDPGFDTQFTRLAAAAKAEGLADFHALPLARFMADPVMKAAAVALVYAWYLGRVGEVLDREEPGPDFITYEGALMWRPTIDATVIPTYSRGRPGFWAAPPASIAKD